MFLYCSEDYARIHGAAAESRRSEATIAFVAYIDDLLAIDAVRWLDEVIESPNVSFYSNSIIAQCNAAVTGLGIVMLPTFVAAGVPDLMRILPDEAEVRRNVWVSVRNEQGSLARIRSTVKFLSQIFEWDRDFLLGRAEGVDAPAQPRTEGVSV